MFSCTTIKELPDSWQRYFLECVRAIFTFYLQPSTGDKQTELCCETSSTKKIFLKHVLSFNMREELIGKQQESSYSQRRFDKSMIGKID